MAGNDSVYCAKKSNAINPSDTTATIFVTSDDTSKPASVWIPSVQPTGGVGAVAFRVRAWGRVTTGGSLTFLATLYSGTSTTAASNTAITALSAQTVATTSANWLLVATFVWDGTSGKLMGTKSADSFNGTTPTIETAAVTTAISSVDLTKAGVTGTSGNSLVMGGTFGTGNASNKAWLDGFCLEVL